MNRVSALLQVRSKLQVRETVDASFKVKSRPFSFLANATSLNEGWTPTMLAELHGVFSFEKLSNVTLMVTTENFNQVLMLIEQWHEARVLVCLRFPNTRRRPHVPDGNFAGIASRDCYIKSRSSFSASDELKQSICDTFADDPMVTVEA